MSSILLVDSLAKIMHPLALARMGPKQTPRDDVIMLLRWMHICNCVCSACISLVEIEREREMQNVSFALAVHTFQFICLETAK